MASIPASAPTPGMVNVPEASNQVSHDAVFWGTLDKELSERLRPNWNPEGRQPQQSGLTRYLSY